MNNMNKLHKLYNEIKKIPRKPKRDKGIMNPTITEEKKMNNQLKK